MNDSDQEANYLAARNMKLEFEQRMKRYEGHFEIICIFGDTRG